jgi:16S rRNA (cytosine967-C5)-methyltransferase
VAASALARVIGAGESLTTLLPRTLQQLQSRQEKAFCQELCYGVLRWHTRLTEVLSTILSKPLKPQDRDLECLLLSGCYQLEYLEIPAYAAVDGCVRAASDLGKTWAKSLVNAVLRRFQREQAALFAHADRSARIRLSCPGWLYDRVLQAWPQEAETILAASNQRPPMTLRVNLSKIDLEAYLQWLQKEEISAQPHPLVGSAVTLEQPRDVHAIPGFDLGLVSVQDAGAQLAAELLNAGPGMRVLDACAAPGGKTAHIMERSSGGLDLTALDQDAARMLRLEDTLARLSLKAEIRVADANQPESWWDGHQYHRILLDAPCSGTGVLRRHPDIKLLRRSSDIESLAALQRRLFDALWPLLVTGGQLLYVTCSILPEENQRQVDAFCSGHDDACRRAATHPALDSNGQILPGRHGMDGFFYALLEKKGCG